MFRPRSQANNTPGSLEIYKASSEYKVKQGIKNMTPKKKLLFFLLPILAVAVGVVVYFILAASGDPGLKLVWKGTTNTIEGNVFTCGEADKAIEIKVDNPSGDDIVSVAAFIKYDPTKIEVTKISKAGTDFEMGDTPDTTPTAPGYTQKIDNTSGLVQVVRGKPASNPVNAGGSGTGFTGASGLLATIYFNVKPGATLLTSGPIFTFLSADPSKSLIVLKGGQALNPEYENGGGVYNGTIRCCLPPNDLCENYEYCPNDNWQITPLPADYRCCKETCQQGIELYLFERQKTVETGQRFEVSVNMRPDYQSINQMKIQLQLSPTDLASAVPEDIIFPGGIKGSATVNGGVITITINDFKTTKSVAATLATITLTAHDTNTGFLKIDFDQSNTIIVADNGSTVVPTFAGGVYKIVRKMIKLCAGTSVTVKPGNNSADFGLCVTPGSDCKLTGGTTPSLYDGECNVNTESSHNLQMTGLTPGTEYNYEIVCDGTDLCGSGATRTKYATDAVGTNHVMYEPLTISGTFKTLSTQELQIINEKAKDVRATSATIEWNTIGGPNGDGLSDSVVCSDGAGNRVVSSNLTSKHSIEIMGLTPGKAYTVTIGSLIADDVVAARAGSSGCACPAGTTCKTKTVSFTTKKQVETADANVILKVNKDRVCDEWLYCNAETQLRVSNATPAERVCFQVGKCNKLDESGNCIGIVDEEKTAATVESPKKVAEIRNVSGYGKVGIDWGQRCLNTGRVCTGNNDCGSGDYAICQPAKIDGLYPYSQMSQIGVPIVIKNYNFENGITLPWKENGNAYIENYNYDNANRVLKIWPKAAGFSGAYAKEIAGSIVNSPKAFYVVSFWAKSDDEQARDVAVELTYGPDPEKPANFVAFKSYNENISKTEDVVKIGNVWREYIVSLSAANLPLGYSGPVGLMIVQNPTSKSTKPFYIDNVSMKSVLELGDNMNYAARSCRLYPNETAPACDYYDSQSGKNYRGWKGYCVETDPGYQERKYASQPMCLLWWPVDIINGESNIFYQDPNAVGYTGRKPLYYCLEGAGNYSRCGKEGIERATYTGVGSGKAIIMDRCSDKYEVHNYYNEDITVIDPFGVSECNGDNNNKAEGLENGGYTFFVCKNDFSGNGGDRPIKIGEENIEYGIKEYELAYVFVDAVGDNGDYPGDFVISREKFGTVETSRGGGTMQFIREDNPTTGKITWIASSNWDGKHNRLRLKLVFDKQKGLETYWVNGADDTGDKHEGETYIIRFYLREPCLKIAQVVDYEGNTVPRMGRIKSEKIADEAAVNIWPGYIKKQDYTPYGSSLVPEPSYDPTQWGLILGGPLYVEPPNTTGELSAPYQVRAGTPLAINSNTRSGKKPGSLGFSGTVCISGKIGNSCPNGNIDCGLVGDTDVYGECVGFDNTGNKDWAEINAIAKRETGEKILQQLFVKSFGIWEWQFVDGAWKYAPSATSNWDPTTLGLGVNPRVSFMYAGAMGNEKDINIRKSGAVTLYFGSWVDEEQKPLVRYTVDWGDGSQSTEAGLTISGRDVSNPHILVHYYKYDPNDTSCPGGKSVGTGTDSAHCEYKIKVQIEDNWGLCNEAGNCADSGAWREYGGVVKVYQKEQITELGAIMNVSPSSLNYNSTGLPQTQTFSVSNPGDKDLTWRIKSILSKNSNTASFLMNFMSSKYNLAKLNVQVGQSIVTPAGNKQDVNIEILGKASVMTNINTNYTDIITLEDMSNGMCESGQVAGLSCTKDAQCGTGGVCKLETKQVEVTLTIDN